MAQLGNLNYSRISRKVAFYWEILGLFIDGEIGRSVSVAEGEALGSNLLQVTRHRGTQLTLALKRGTPCFGQLGHRYV
jgi:hypothetical protein